MVDQSTPSNDPANTGSLTGALREVLKKFKQGMLDDMLPAKVIAYDRDRNVATVLPIIQVIDTNGDRISRPQIAEVPVIAMGNSVAVMNINLLPGDTGWIKSNDRDISTYVNNLVEGGPPTARMHTFEDGIFIPDKVKDFTIVDSDSEFVIQTLDGTHRIELFSDKIKLTSGGSIVDVNPTDIMMSIGGSSITISGAGIAMISPSGTLTHNGTNVGDTHTHTGSPTAPTGGVSNTGAPV